MLSFKVAASFDKEERNDTAAVYRESGPGDCDLFGRRAHRLLLGLGAESKSMERKS